MSVITPMTDQEAITKLSACFLPVYQVIRDEFIQSAETFVFAAEGTRHSYRTREGLSLSKLLTYEADISKQVEYIENCPSLVVLTNKRWFRATLSEHLYKRRIRISDNKTFLGRWAAGEKLKFYWVIPPAEYPIYQNKKSLRQNIAESVKHLGLSEISVVQIVEHSVDDNVAKPPLAIQLLKLILGQGLSYSFGSKDGSHIHKLLQLSSLSSGTIPLATTGPSTTNNGTVSADPAERLRQLNRLYEQGLITEQEYQSKRQELLSQL